MARPLKYNNRHTVRLDDHYDETIERMSKKLGVATSVLLRLSVEAALCTESAVMLISYRARKLKDAA